MPTTKKAPQKDLETILSRTLGNFTMKEREALRTKDEQTALLTRFYPHIETVVLIVIGGLLERAERANTYTADELFKTINIRSLELLTDLDAEACVFAVACLCTVILENGGRSGPWIITDYAGKRYELEPLDEQAQMDKRRLKVSPSTN